MATKSLGIFIATPGRKSLWKTLSSIAYQGAPVEDVLVVGDGFHKATAELVEVAASALSLPVRYVATEKTRDWGHTQQNYALKHVRGDYLIYQDDDDIFVPRALTEVAKLVTEFRDPHPLVGRIKTPRLGLVWCTPGNVLDGHCIVVPNDKEKLGFFTADYNGDQGYIRHCLGAYDECSWTDRIWTLCRPAWNLIPMWATEDSHAWCCDLYRGRGGVIFEDGPVANVLLQHDEGTDRYIAAVNSLHPAIMVHEYQEIAEFIMYAAQSKDVWIRTKRSEGALALGLRAANFKEHSQTDDYTEFTHDWPPDFWEPVVPFNTLYDPDTGKRHDDWRDDVWGRGRR